MPPIQTATSAAAAIAIITVTTTIVVVVLPHLIVTVVKIALNTLFVRKQKIKAVHFIVVQLAKTKDVITLNG